MANVFRSKEVYKNIRFEIDKTKKVIPVQGVYISGEYRPPYYNEPCVHIYEISSQDCNVADFKTDEYNTQGMETAGMYMFDVSTPTYSIQRYSTEYAEASPTETGGMYLFDISVASYNLQRYGKDYVDTQGMETAGMYTLIFFDQGYSITRHSKNDNGSTPEPIIRITGLSSENCIVENYT